MDKAQYRNTIVQNLKNMGTYRTELDLVIDVLAENYFLRELNMKEWEKAGYKQVVPFTNKGGNENEVKSPFFQNNLQYCDTILKYSKELGLTGASAQKMGIAFEDDEDDDDGLIK